MLAATNGRAGAGDWEALREALRSGWRPAVASAATADAVARFVAAAGANRSFLLPLGSAVARLGDLARAAGAQRALGEAMLPHVPAIVAARPQLLEPVLGILSGTVPLERVRALGFDTAALARALAAHGSAGADDEPADPLAEAILHGDRGAVTRLIADELARAGVPALVERLRPWTPALAPLAITIARTLPPSDDALRLAVVLGDPEACVHSTGDADLAAAAAWTAGDRQPLATLYAGWAQEAGVASRSLEGHDLDRMMQGFATATGAPSTHDRLVSIIMTAADPEPDLLARAVDSVLAQSHAGWELLLIDDGSANGDALAAQAARDPRIRLIRLAANVGPYVARNVALDHATGDAIAIHDADDVAHPERLRAQLDRLAHGPCVISRALRFDRDGGLHLEADGRVTGDGTMTTLFDRRLFERIGRFAPVRSRGDLEFLDRIRRTIGTEAIATIDCPLMLCRAAPTTLSHATRRTRMGALRLFRRAYTQRAWWRDGEGWRGAGSLVIPWGLEP